MPGLDHPPLYVYLLGRRQDSHRLRAGLHPGGGGLLRRPGGLRRLHGRRQGEGPGPLRGEGLRHEGTATWSSSGSMLERKTVLITGSSRGIGAAAARRFAQEGWGVGLHCRAQLDRAQALGAELRALGGPGGGLPGGRIRPGPGGPGGGRFPPGLRPPGRAGVQRGPGPAGAVHRRHPGQLAPGAGGEPGRGVPLLPGGAAPHAPPEGGEAHHPVLHVGDRWGPPARWPTPPPRRGSSA